jgi:hypothetical protein
MNSATPLTKTEQARAAFARGDVKEALRIAKDFNLIFTKEQCRTMQVAYECLTGNEAFYKMLKFDTELNIKNALLILYNKFTDKE